MGVRRVGRGGRTCSTETTPPRARAAAPTASSAPYTPHSHKHTHVYKPWTSTRTTKNSTEKNGQPDEVFQALCPYCGGVNAARSWAEAAPADLSVPGVFVQKGKSWIDNEPVWVFNYDKAQRAFGFDFRGFRDELRQAAPGLMIGKMITEASNATFTNGWNPSNRSVEQVNFVLMQTCASNGEYPSRPIDRVVL